MSNPERRKIIEAVLRDHAATFIDQDGDERCQCDKWLEPGEHEWPWHVAGLVEDAIEPRSPHCEFCSACHPNYPCRPDCHICWPGVSGE